MLNPLASEDEDEAEIEAEFENLMNEVKFSIYFQLLTRRLSGFEILDNATLILQKWLVSRHFANIFHNLNFSEEYL